MTEIPSNGKVQTYTHTKCPANVSAVRGKKRALATTNRKWPTIDVEASSARQKAIECRTA